MEENKIETGYNADILNAPKQKFKERKGKIRNILLIASSKQELESDEESTSSSIGSGNDSPAPVKKNTLVEKARTNNKRVSILSLLKQRQ